MSNIDYSILILNVARVYGLESRQALEFAVACQTRSHSAIQDLYNDLMNNYQVEEEEDDE